MVEPREHGYAEGQRLSRAGLAASEDVPPSECARKGAGLDGERGVKAATREDGDQGWRQPVSAEGGRLRLRLPGGFGEGAIQSAS